MLQSLQPQEKTRDGSWGSSGYQIEVLENTYRALKFPETNYKREVDVARGENSPARANNNVYGEVSCPASSSNYPSVFGLCNLRYIILIVPPVPT